MEREQRRNIFSKFHNLVHKRKPTILAGSSRNINRRYEFPQQVLGAGSFATTHLCKDRRTGITYACKSIQKETITSGTLPKDYLSREVNILKTLPAHPNIISLKETYEDDKEIHLILELCEGGELFEEIQARRYFSETEAKKIVKDVVQVVQWCHIHGVMHRDVKPENFLFGRNNTLKAIDFGFAAVFKPGQRFRDLAGSPPYMAPEIFQRNYGPEVDVWSAGIVAYYVLCGRQPFRAAENAELKEKILTAEIDFKRAPWPRVSEEAKALLKGMLERNPEKRLTPRQILNHPWLTNDAAVTNSRDARPSEEASYSYGSGR